MVQPRQPRNMRLLVDPPVGQPSPYGLLSVADIRTESDVHWQAGITWRSNCGGADTTYDDCISSSPSASGVPSGKGSNAVFTPRGATPFTVFTKFDCSLPDFYENAEATALKALQTTESWQLERAFWTGAAGGVNNVVLPHLADDTAITQVDGADGFYVVTLQPAADIVTGAGLDPPCALAALEQAMANCLNGVGVIHMTVFMATILASRMLIRQDGNRLRTLNGNLVVAGNGYPGTAPDGTTPAVNITWMYGTGPVFGYRGTPWLSKAAPDSFSRDVNTIEALAERTYVLAFDCCLLAMPVCLDCTMCNSGITAAR